MLMIELKVGDYLKCIDDYSPFLTIDRIYKIIKIQDEGRFMRYFFTDDTGCPDRSVMVYETFFIPYNKIKNKFKYILKNIVN